MVDQTIPTYRVLMESHDKPQSLQKTRQETTLERLEVAQPKK